MLDRRSLMIGLALSSVASGALAQGRPVIPTNQADLTTMAREHVAALSRGHAAWGFGREEHWSVDLDRGSIEWTLPDRIARAPVELIGTWASDLGTYRWGWDHPAVSPSMARAARQTKAFADTHGLAALQAVEPTCSREQASEFASIAVLIGDLQGLYVGQASRTALAYLGFGEVTLSPRR